MMEGGRVGLCFAKAQNRKGDPMFKYRWLAVLFLIFLSVQTSFADDSAKIHGIWRLVSFEVEFQATGERQNVRGKNPTGYIMFTPEGRMAVIITNEGRKPATTEQDRADLYKSLVAYTGLYRVEGDKWITKVDVSANPAWVGTEQTRSFKIDGNRLQESTGVMQFAAQPEKGMVRYVLTYERVK
jgi:hypothetical protein